MSDHLVGADTGCLADFARLVPSAVLVVDSQGALVWADESARDLFGVGGETDAVPAMFGRDGSRLPPAERPYMQVFDTGEPMRNLSCRAELADRRRPVTIDAVPLTDDAGVSRVALAVEPADESAVPPSPDGTPSRLGEVFDRIDDAFFALDTDWRFTYVNSRAETLLRQSEADLLGSSVWESFSEAEGTAFHRQYERAMETQEPVSFEAHYPPLDEWFEVRAYPSESGLSVYFTGVTERKERERELERYETILQTIDDGVYVVDDDGYFTFVNEAYADLTGYPTSELVGMHRSEIVDRDVIEQADRIHRRLRQSEADTARLEADVQTADGNSVVAEATFCLIEQGDETRRVGVIRDVSQRKAQERELATQSRQQRAVAALGRTALDDPELDDFLDQVVTVVAETLENDYCKILDLDGDTDELRLRQGVGWDDGLVGEAAVAASVDDSQAAYTLRQGEPVVVEDLAADPRFSGPDLLTDHGVKSGISVVLGNPEDPWGILGTHDTDRKTFSEHDIDFVQSVANLVASTIDTYDRRQTLEAGTEAFRTAHEIAVRDVPIEDRARELLALGREYLGVDVGFQTHISDDTQTIELVSDEASGMREGQECPLEHAYCKTVMDEGGLVAVDDASRAEWVDDDAYETWGFDAYVGHILTIDGDPYGSIGFAAADPRPDGFDELELAFVEQIAQWMRYEFTRQRRESKLAERRRRYRTLIDNVPDGAVALFDENLRYTTFGGAPPADLDVMASEIEGARISDALPAELAEQLVPNYRATLGGERREFTLRHGDEIREIRTVPITDSDGTVVSGMAIAQDITERKERERRLRRQREQLAVLNDINSLVQEISEAVVEQSDPASVQSIIRDSVQASKFYETAWIGQVDTDRETIVRAADTESSDLPVTPPLDIDDTESPTVQAARTGEIQVSRIRHDADAKPWMAAAASEGIESVAAVPLTSEGAMYGILTLYTARPDAFAKAERLSLGRLGTIVAHAILSMHRKTRLDRSERLYRRLAENIPNGAVTMFDADHRYQVAAGELLDWLDLDPRDLRGKRPTETDVLPEQVAEWAEQNLDAALDGEHVADRIEFEGHILDVQTIPMRDDEGSVTGALTLSQDITERVEQRRELEHEHERLELLIRLIRHNFLNSLNVVDARLEMLRGRVDYEVSDHLETAQMRTAEMIDLVETIRSLTNATIDNTDHELEPTPIDAVLAEELESARNTHPEAEFSVDRLPSADVWADNLLGEALENILHNAVQHNDKSAPRVTVDVAATDETVTVSIADNGPGIDDDMKARIFEKGTHGFQNPGTGFGLHIVREIVDSYDGEVRVRDNDPDGTVFELTFHRAESA